MAIKEIIGLLLLFVLVFTGCRPQALTPAKYVQYVEDQSNGFRKEAEVGDWKYKVQFTPSSYIYLHEKRDQSFSKADCFKRKEGLTDWRFFNVYARHKTISKGSPIRLLSSSLDDYNTKLSFYLNINKNNFTLVTDSLILYPTVYNFENSYNLSPEDVFVVGFKMRNSYPVKQMTLVYNDELLKTGILKFVFKSELINKEPALIF